MNFFGLRFKTIQELIGEKQKEIISKSEEFRLIDLCIYSTKKEAHRFLVNRGVKGI